eukprot:TRINITY_DN3971_c0_g1_i1.p1 TRINITY_DN3971_c0_g1~~TRINITY_DN3971_c0_g1_i1.p1  ORF type:complete len:274 (+),score=35.06 TRINITY_DN3971_c0_g1_i1:47-823(+)
MSVRLGMFFYYIDTLEDEINEVYKTAIYSSEKAILFGPKKSGKSTLLFRYVYNEAVNHDAKVLYVCNRAKMQSNLPLLPPEDDDSMKRTDYSNLSLIQMVYLQNDEELRRFFANIHLHPELPSVIVVDDFGFFFEDDAAKFRTMAIISDAVDYINRSLDIEREGDDVVVTKERNQCTLLLSETVEESDRSFKMSAYSMWFPLCLVIRGKSNPFTLVPYKIRSELINPTWAASYSLTQTYNLLSLELIPNEDTHPLHSH